MRSGYSDKDKRNFAKLSVELGVEEVARMAGVSPPVLSRWRLQFGFANRLLSEKEREKFARLSMEIGVPAAAEQAGVHQASVVSWRKEFGLSQPREKPAAMRRAAVKRSVLSLIHI